VAVHFLVPAPWNSSDKNGVAGLQNSYSGVIAALKVMFERAAVRCRRSVWFPLLSTCHL